MLYLLLLPWLLCAAIIETPNFRDSLSHITKETLVLLDIDDTLLIPEQMLGCDEWFKYRLAKHMREGMNHSEALEKSLAEWEAVRHITKMNLVEFDAPTIIQNLQNQNICVMGLTTQGLALATRTSSQLRENQIELRHSAPSNVDHYMIVNHSGVLFRNGVLFTSGAHKGKALFTLLNKIGLEPKRIVFVNDKQSHLEEIEQEANARAVEFIGLRYSYSDARKKAFDPAIAEYQFTHSSFDRILSDEEATKHCN